MNLHIWFKNIISYFCNIEGIKYNEQQESLYQEVETTLTSYKN